MAIPRLADTSEFERAGFHEELKASLRAAQKSAVAQRKRVQVSVTAAGASASWCGVAAGGDSCASPTTGCSGVLTGPGGKPLAASAPAGVVIAPALAFRFDCLGRPMLSDTAPMATTGFTVDGGRTVTVEAETGYVH